MFSSRGVLRNSGGHRAEKPDADHLALSAGGTLAHGNSGELLDPVLVIADAGSQGFGNGNRHSQQAAAQRQLRPPAPIAEKPVVADALESIGQDVNQLCGQSNYVAREAQVMFDRAPDVDLTT